MSGPPGADSSTFTAGKVGQGKPLTVKPNTNETKDSKDSKDTKKDTRAMRPLFGGKPAKKGDIF
jgi:hypothetical protein